MYWAFELTFNWSIGNFYHFSFLPVRNQTDSLVDCMSRNRFFFLTSLLPHLQMCKAYDCSGIKKGHIKEGCRGSRNIYFVGEDAFVRSEFSRFLSSLGRIAADRLGETLGEAFVGRNPQPSNPCP